ncbi:SRPBCC family protein [Acinetobacter sp. WCHAc060006]|nr:SRPBCC family protein [Acinetobacter cumulans]RZG59305.1 SRPBCC family protein [Acinetobacter sp. WCHAc060006]
MQQIQIKTWLMLTSLIFAGNVSAKILPWKAQIPSALTEFNHDPQTLASLTGERILIYAHPTQSIQLPTMPAGKKTTGKYYSASVVIPANVQQVSRLLLNYTNYAGLFPTLKSAKVVEQQGSISQVKYNIHIPTPIPVLNFRETVLMQHQADANSISTLILDAPVPYAAGKIKWFELAPNQTLVTLTQWGDLSQPKGFLFSKILNAIPDAKLGIPAGTNAFLLESLQKRFKTSQAQPLGTGVFPTVGLDRNEQLKVAQLSQNSQEPVSFVLTAKNVPYPHGTEKLRFSTSYQYYAHSPAQLQQWLTPNSYQQLFPNQIKQVRVRKLDNKQMDASYKISVGLGVINIPFDFKMRFNYATDWQNEFYANGGDLKFVRGGMQLTPMNQGTLLSVTSAMKIDQDAPFLLRAMRSMPYSDMLPALGGNTVFVLKVKQKAGA